MPQLPGGGEGIAPDVDPMGYHSEVLLHAPGMPKIADEGGVGVLPGLFLAQLVHYLLIQGGYLAKNRNLFATQVWYREKAQQL